MKTVVVLGSANGSRNLGDECMWEALAGFLIAQDPTVRIVTDGSADWLPPFEGITVLPFLSHQMKVDYDLYPTLARFSDKNLITRGLSRIRRNKRTQKLVDDRIRSGPKTALERRWYEALKASSALYISGAGAMTDQYAVHGIFSWLLLTTWAKQLGIPVYAVGQGIGPIQDKNLIAPLTQMLSQLDYLGVREVRSQTLVESLSIPRLNSELTLDWALGIKVSSEDRQQASELTKSYFRDKDYIVLSLHLHQPLALDRKFALKKLTKEVVSFAASIGIGVLFVPNMTSFGHSDDRKLADSLIQSLPSELRDICKVHRKQSDASIVRALLHDARGVFTTRYHPLVFALTESTPTIGLYFDEYYVQKLGGASQQFGIQGNIHSVTYATKTITQLFADLEEQDIVPISEQEVDRSLFAPLRNIGKQS